MAIMVSFVAAGSCCVGFLDVSFALRLHNIVSIESSKAKGHAQTVVITLFALAFNSQSRKSILILTNILCYISSCNAM